jgi:carbon catabolite-derepressing protein kinase
MEVILELYQTLKALGMEWREKGGEWGMKGTEEVDSDSYGKESMDIYFVETRWRVRDVVVRIFLPVAQSHTLIHAFQVRMDLQLYQVDPANYLVDFRNMGYYKASTSPTAKSPFERRAPSASSSPSSPSSEGSQNSADSKREREPGEPEHHTRDKKPVDISNAFLFLECACRLIIELAGG